jgi:hypothetical protein
MSTEIVPKNAGYYRRELKKSQDKARVLKTQVSQLRHFIGVLTGWIDNLHPEDAKTIDAMMAQSSDDWMEEQINYERERCCQIIFSMCESDNVAQRTVDKIRGNDEAI